MPAVAMVKQIGQISQKGDRQGRRQIEWRIRNISSYAVVDKCYSSPRFSIQGSRWYLEIYPNGHTVYECTGFISLYLHKEDASTSPEGANYSLGVKKADGTIKEKCKRIIWLFDDGDGGYGEEKLLDRLEMMQRRSELAPSDVLTLTCSLWVDDKSTSGLDTLSEDFIDLFISKKNCDTVLKVQHKEFPVHKLILSARSTVFEAMFDVDMKEKVTGRVVIEDCDPEAFNYFLTYLYSGRCEINSDNVFELYRIAHKYDVEELESACILHMMSRLSVENVCETAILAEEFVERGLKHKIQVFFNDNFGEIISTAAWIPFLKENTLFANKLISAMAYDKKL